MRVIIVDDDDIVVRFLETYLVKHGFQVVGKAYDGKSAIDILENVKFDGLIVDYYLPDMTGVEVAKQAIKTYKDIKIIIITASENVVVKDFPVVRKKVGEFKNLIKHLSS